MIITLAGSNDFLRGAELKKLLHKFVQDYGEAGVEKIQGDEIETGRLLDLIQAGNLFAPERLVIVKDLSANKLATEKLTDILASVGEGVDLILVESNLDMRTSYAKTLQKQTDFRKFEPMQEAQLAGWVVEEVKERGGSITRPVAAKLVDRVGGSQQLLSSELDKLLAHNATITAESVELLTEASPRSSIFDLLESAFAGKTSRMLALYREQRAQKVEPQAILSMIAWQLHALIVTKLGDKRSPQEIASMSKLSPYTVRNSQALARSLSVVQLQTLIDSVINLEITLKSKALNADDAVQALLLQIVAG